MNKQFGLFGALFAGAIAQELERQNQYQKQTKMKNKKFYHTFDYKGREITLLLYIEQEQGHPWLKQPETSTLSVTYAVRLHEDKPVEGLTKKILFGRLEKGKFLEQFTTSTRFGFQNAYLKGLAFSLENEIKRGDLEIAGVSHGIAKDAEAGKLPERTDSSERVEDAMWEALSNESPVKDVE